MMNSKENNIIICGDIHGYWSLLNQLISKKKPDIILACGDFGYFPNLDDYTTNHHNIKSNNTKIYWCDGNHEDHWSLEKLRKKKISEITPNVYYMKRGSVLQLDDGRNVLFMGGADSIDKRVRTLGYDWFPDEIITQRDIENLPDINIDIVISHTCPSIVNGALMKRGVFIEKFKDPSQEALTYIWEKYTPKLWYFGHFHTHLITNNGYTTFTALNYAGSSGRWWIYLM